jgi:predicted O-methyltransferase YrrM
VTGSVIAHTITHIENVIIEGIYAPLTMNGIIVVDNIVASAYVEQPPLEAIFKALNLHAVSMSQVGHFLTATICLNSTAF